MLTFATPHYTKCSTTHLTPGHTPCVSDSTRLYNTITKGLTTIATALTIAATLWCRRYSKVSAMLAQLLSAKLDFHQRHELHATNMACEYSFAGQDRDLLRALLDDLFT